MCIKMSQYQLVLRSSQSPEAHGTSPSFKEWPVLVVAPTVVVDNWINEADAGDDHGFFHGN